MIRGPKYKFINWKLIIIYLTILIIGLISLSSVDKSEFNKLSNTCASGSPNRQLNSKKYCTDP